MALEFILVIFPVMILMFVFFNLMFLLGNLMLTQSTMNKSVQQVAAVGCVPTGLKTRLQSADFLAVSNVRVNFVTTGKTWDHGNNIGANGVVQGGRQVPDCSAVTAANRLNSGDYIYAQMRYNQRLFLTTSSNPELRSGALTISQTLEGEG